MATIFIYKINYYKEVYTEENGENKQNLSYKELEKDLKRIIKKNISNNCLYLVDASGWCVLEILNKHKDLFDSNIECEDIEDANCIFIRLGGKKESFNLQKRNMKNLNPKKIDTDEDENIEIYTYMYIFFEKENEQVIIAYVTARSAPNVRKIENIIPIYNDYDCKLKKLEVLPILAENVVGVLNEKSIINSFSYTVSVPSDAKLDLKGIGLSEDDFDKLININSTKITVSVQGKRHENIIKDKGIFSKIKNRLENEALKVTDFNVKAKNYQRSNLLAYDFLDDKFAFKVNFTYGTDDNEDLRRKEAREALLREYSSHKNELLKYVRK